MAAAIPFQIFAHKKLIICDIQPAYSTGITFSLKELVDYMKQFDTILYLFNDDRVGVKDTSADVVKMLLPAGYSAELDKKVKFFPKAFFNFRDLLDKPEVSFETAVRLVKAMLLHSCPNAKDLPAHILKQALNNSSLERQIKNEELNFYYEPDLAREFVNWYDCTEIGGFQNQCNIEIEVYLTALGVKYTQNKKFVF